jgi:hypothetical protein
MVRTAMRANMQAKGQGKKRDSSGREFVGTRSITRRMGSVSLSQRRLIVWHGAHHTDGPWRGMLCKETNFTTKTRRTRSRKMLALRAKRLIPSRRVPASCATFADRLLRVLRAFVVNLACGAQNHQDPSRKHPARAAKPGLALPPSE